MCKECGCEENDKSDEEIAVEINKSITEANDVLAEDIAQYLKKKKILAVNIMGAPGSGKTSFIEGLTKFISPMEIVVIEGDLESDIDKKRLQASGIDTIQINTHSGCHLNSMMVNSALRETNLSGKKYLLIENVGNLVCPAGVKIGAHINILISSTSEGADKPKKYPYIFMDVNMVVIAKSDLKELVNFQEEEYINDIKKINSKVLITHTSTKDPQTFKRAAEFLIHERHHLVGHEHHH